MVLSSWKLIWEPRTDSVAVRVKKNPIELKVIFLEIVYLDLYSDKVWGSSIFLFCTPPGDIYRRPLLIPFLPSGRTVTLETASLNYVWKQVSILNTF